MQPLDPRVEIGRVRLRVADLDRALAFYAGILGFDVTHRKEHRRHFLGQVVTHTTSRCTRAMRLLTERPRSPTRNVSRSATPTAWRWATRCSGSSEGRIAIERAIDDGISESLFVRDPDGHHVELYCDRPRAEQRERCDRPAQERLRTLDLESLRAVASVSPRRMPPARRCRAALAMRAVSGCATFARGCCTCTRSCSTTPRAAYEMDRGRVGSNANLLQLVISDPWFAWLHSLSEMVVRIDETVEPGAPATQRTLRRLLDQVERLLTASESGDGFARRYYEALQRQPAVVLAHADVRRTLKSMR